MTHICSPYEIKRVFGEVLTTQFSIIQDGKRSTFITDTYSLKDDKGNEVFFQSHRQTTDTFSYMNIGSEGRKK